MESELPETIDGRWRYIEHTATHTRVMIRLQRQTWRTPPEVRITGVIHLPRIPGDSITSQQLRELPIARINDVPLSTAQGWLVKARSLGLLPPGRRGRRGNP